MRLLPVTLYSGLGLGVEAPRGHFFAVLVWGLGLKTCGFGFRLDHETCGLGLGAYSHGVGLGLAQWSGMH